MTRRARDPELLPGPPPQSQTAGLVNLTISRHLDTCHGPQVPGQCVNLFSGVQIPHDEVAVLRARNDLAFVCHGNGDGRDGIGVTDEHLSEEENKVLGAYMTAKISKALKLT